MISEKKEDTSVPIDPEIQRAVLSQLFSSPGQE